MKVHASIFPRSSSPERPFPWGIKQIKAPLAWNKSMGSRVKIAIIDTGADYTHPDLKPSLARGINLFHPHALPQDDNGHGTHLAGTIAAANKRNGIVGVSPLASIYPVKAFDHNGSAYVSDIILGIEWCIRNRMDIINMSFGMKNRSQALYNAIRRAHQAGIAIIASSGNAGKRGMVDYPARFPQTISVGATNRKQAIARFSNQGKRIDIYAPGDRVWSTWLGGRYQRLSGTSMATSHISGVAALILSRTPGISPARLKSILKRTATPLKSRKSSPSRTGQVDAFRSIRSATVKRTSRKKINPGVQSDSPYLI